MGVEVKMVLLADVRMDGATQPRERDCEEALRQYREDWQAGVRFPPVELVRTSNGNLYLFDGFHRCKSAKLAGIKEIQANIRDGTLSECRWLAAGANQRHGVRRTRADLRASIIMAIQSEPGRGKTVAEIAEHVGCSQQYVSQIRKDNPNLTRTSKVADAPKKIGKDGKARSYDPAKQAEAGRKRSEAAAEKRVAKDAATKTDRIIEVALATRIDEDDDEAELLPAPKFNTYTPFNPAVDDDVLKRCSTLARKLDGEVYLEISEIWSRDVDATFLACSQAAILKIVEGLKEYVKSKESQAGKRKRLQPTG